MNKKKTRIHIPNTNSNLKFSCILKTSRWGWCSLTVRSDMTAGWRTRSRRLIWGGSRWRYRRVSDRGIKFNLGKNTLNDKDASTTVTVAQPTNFLIIFLNSYTFLIYFFAILLLVLCISFLICIFVINLCLPFLEPQAPLSSHDQSWKFPFLTSVYDS